MKSDVQSASGSYHDLDTSVALISTLSEFPAIFRVITLGAVRVVRNYYSLDSELRK